MAANQTSFKVLMFPWLSHGHVSPYFELATKLSKRNFHIYFCSTPFILDSIRKDLSNYDHHHIPIQLVELHLPSLPQLPPHYHSLKTIPPHLRPTLINAFQSSSSNFSDIITNLKPDLLIYDIMQPWSAKIAASQGIPAVHFVTGGSTQFSFLHHGHTHNYNYDTFPNHRAIKLKDYEKRVSIANMKNFKEINEKHQGFAFGILDLSHNIVLIKSCRAIEGEYIDHLYTLCGKKIVPTGPLVVRFPHNIWGIGDDHTEIANWLSQKSQFSTLYISFGSENYFSKEQIAEIAKGLEMSDVNFIWVARTPPGSDGVIDNELPEGFLERVKQRGIVVQKWAPQAAILAHPSVGGFLSHCGWGSVMESIYFEVPVVAVPLKYDQPLNARLVVEAGVGVEVVRDENGEFNGEGVAKAINEVIVEERGEGFRRRARELSKKMKMEEEEAMDEVVEELSKICLKK